MPVKIACPKCKTQYQLPDSALGKAVKCKNCGTAFKTKAPSNNQQLTVAKKRELAVSQPSQSELAKFGIDGPIKKQADIFSAPPPNPKHDPLGNYIEDPGFADIDSIEDELEIEDDGNEGMSAILNNPYARPTKTKKKSGNSSGTKGKKKRKKKGVHPAVKDSLDQATMTLLIIGVLTMSAFGFMLYNVEGDTQAMINNMQVDGEEGFFDEEEVVDALSQGAKYVYMCGMGIGLIFVIFAFGVQIFPITCSILALIFFVLLELAGCLVNPLSLVDPFDWLRRVIICGALGKAFMDSLNARSYTKMMEARAAAGRG